MLSRPQLAMVVAAVAVAGAPAAAAKDFRPGDVRVCGASRCLPISHRLALASISSFYYGAPTPDVAKAPSRRAHSVELRFSNGYVTGVAAGRRFDKFLSFGVNLGQFRARTWYDVPPPAATEIERIASKLHPRSLPANILGRSH